MITMDGDFCIDFCKYDNSSWNGLSRMTFSWSVHGGMAKNHGAGSAKLEDSYINANEVRVSW